MNKPKKRPQKSAPKSTTVLQKIFESNIKDFTITDLKHLNGSLFYRDFKERYPQAEDLPIQTIVFEGKRLTLFEFPESFEGKIRSKIFFHFKRKAENFRRERACQKNEGKSEEDDESFFQG
ncbi:hypothetical protein [Microscilla marina]|uniref:Uncharacterized protein n=1 Tax=Microscilla marina ATCC 23134 TaxID=313606 RepID=A1ZEI5_MICM2|nr:hypothetical protein [Microscilla marina]EAY30937.1 hypothetical protein M23134_07344 [Microscilla marina ATCC 23134]